MTRTILISGAASGIGHATAELFLQGGDTVVGIDRAEGRAGELATGFPATFSRVQADLLEPAAYPVIGEHLRELGRPADVLVNCAGIREIRPALELSLDEWNRVFGVNVTAAFLLFYHFNGLRFGRQGFLDHGHLCLFFRTPGKRQQTQNHPRP